MIIVICLTTQILLLCKVTKNITLKTNKYETKKDHTKNLSITLSLAWL